MLKYNKFIKPLSQKLRNSHTDHEQKLWHQIRRKQVLGVQFYRQKPIGNYIADFYCPKVNLIIEIDGGQHFREENKEKDIIRDEYFKSLGLHILRFSNADIEENLDGVTSVIFEFVQKSIC